jgi:hypothetical protein
MTTNIPNSCKIDQIAKKQTNIFRCKSLQNLTKLIFLFENIPSGNPGELVPRHESRNKQSLTKSYFSKEPFLAWPSLNMMLAGITNSCQMTDRVCEKNRPRGNPIAWASSVICKNTTLKVSDRPIGENSPNLVAAVAHPRNTTFKHLSTDLVEKYLFIWLYVKDAR